ncbi:MAG: 4-hydroxy-3-methylbut-2-enyl diphosphate reductase [Gammaproteobacteria bacterium]|nr:4-hydroxy-3-methylbut-2-enyl diphosphate reductase [Gammaproteobacteria bacterium]MCF6231093.1 4-hydroxy-3-methylbut-2-enyl diphosphate reductase [Gammaproteobacteria bacterium]
MKVILANPRGFCAGVDRAIEIVEKALEIYGAPTYVRHEVVHNRFVVESLKAKGAVFVQEVDQVPDDNLVIFSAHGVSQQVRKEAKQRGLRILDATCPLVTKVHLEVMRYAKDKRDVVLIGHAGHPEVEGTMGQYKGAGEMYLVETPEDVAKLKVADGDNLAFVTQTTLSMDDAMVVIEALRQHFPTIIGPKKDDVCYATQNRQDAVKRLAKNCDIVLVVGSPNSSNSNRLREVAERHDIPAYLIDNADEIDARWLEGKTCVGVTAGASAPEVLVVAVIDKLKSLGATTVRSDNGEPETIEFPIPRELTARR